MTFEPFSADPEKVGVFWRVVRYCINHKKISGIKLI